jgi:hypothetical protein
MLWQLGANEAGGKYAEKHKESSKTKEIISTGKWNQVRMHLKYERTENTLKSYLKE